MLRRFSIAPFLLALLAQGLPLPAQTSDQPARQYIHSITFQGAEPYASAELLPLTGLKSGQLLPADGLRQATQRLLDSGLFSDAQATNTGATGLRDITFTLKPVPDAALLHVSFANFIWLSSRDLEASIRRASPVLHAGLPDPHRSPVAAGICDDVAAGLVQVLKGRGVIATVAYQVVEPNLYHDYRSVEFRVTDPAVRLDSADITGYPNFLIAPVAEAITRAKASPYNEGTAGVTIEDLLLAPARDRGYIHATLAQEKRLHRTLPHEITVQYSAQYLTGPLFRIRRLRFESTSFYSSSDFGRDSKVQPGDIAIPPTVEAAAQPIRNAYRAQGYIDVLVNTSLVFDNEHGAVDLVLSVVPGEIYRVGKVVVTGLPADAKAEFDSAWKLNRGVVYSEHYIGSFATSDPSLKKLNAYTYTYRIESDHASHTVELILNFRKKE